MSTNQTAPATIDAYIAAFPPEVQALLQQIRQVIHNTIPNLGETISYSMPPKKPPQSRNEGVHGNGLCRYGDVAGRLCRRAEQRRWRAARLVFCAVRSRGRRD